MNLDTIAENRLLWGNNAHGYYEKAEAGMDRQWENTISPFINQVKIDYSNTVDLAAGRGRNSIKLLEYVTFLTLVDVNEENLQFTKKRFSEYKNISYIHNNGKDLQDIQNESVTFIYCWDAMVHFDIADVCSYVGEFYRILKPGGIGFCHHSNYTNGVGLDIRKNPHCRNFMSKDIFNHLVVTRGLKMIDQKLRGWDGELKDLDCLSLFQKPTT